MDEETGSLFILPWYKEDPPIIVEAKIGRRQDNQKQEVGNDDKKTN